MRVSNVVNSGAANIATEKIQSPEPSSEHHAGHWHTNRAAFVNPGDSTAGSHGAIDVVLPGTIE